MHGAFMGIGSLVHTSVGQLLLSDLGIDNLPIMFFFNLVNNLPA